MSDMLRHLKAIVLRKVLEDSRLMHQAVLECVNL